MGIYNAIVHEAEEGGYWAEVPDLPCRVALRQFSMRLLRTKNGQIVAALV